MSADERNTNIMKKVFSVVGARPNFMKVAPIHRALAAYSDHIQHVVVHTGQHYDAIMSDAFFDDLDMPEPGYFLRVGSGSHATQTAKIMTAFETVCLEGEPDLVIVVGDVNSTLACALTATKLGIPVIHVEAGLRSGDRTMPEELNRLATDAVCDYAYTSEPSAIEHLLREGWAEDRIKFVDNTMIDSQHYARERAVMSPVLKELGLIDGDYILVTLHRPSNVDNQAQLSSLLNALANLSLEKTVVLPAHPRTMSKIEAFGLGGILDEHPQLKVIGPQGYVRFLRLVMGSDFVITDSGGLQEETTALGIPCLTVRTTTERPITCDLGTNQLIEPNGETLLEAARLILGGTRKKGSIPMFWDGATGGRIARRIMQLLYPENSIPKNDKGSVA